VPAQPEPGREYPSAERAGPGPVALLVHASLVVPQRVIGAHLFAADVTRRDSLPRQHVARRQVPPQRVHVAQLIA
jgi:hypothetical protein